MCSWYYQFHCGWNAEHQVCGFKGLKQFPKLLHYIISIDVCFFIIFRLEDEEGPEIGSVFIPGSKKQNLNHLLNFKYPSRSGTDIRSVAPRRQAQHVSYRHEHDLYLRA